MKGRRTVLMGINALHAACGATRHSGRVRVLRPFKAESASPRLRAHAPERHGDRLFLCVHGRKSHVIMADGVSPQRLHRCAADRENTAQRRLAPPYRAPWWMSRLSPTRPNRAPRES